MKFKNIYFISFFLLGVKKKMLFFCELLNQEGTSKAKKTIGMQN